MDTTLTDLLTVILGSRKVGQTEAFCEVDCRRVGSQDAPERQQATQRRETQHRKRLCVRGTASKMRGHFRTYQIENNLF